MGAITADQVPAFDVMEDQQQFGETTVSPPIGTPIKGGARHVTIDDVIREHGPRFGPVPKAWRRALVYVSRDRLASAAEMDYWNFYAQRLGDRGQANLPAYDGYVPFRTATRNVLPLSTAIQPRSGAASQSDRYRSACFWTGRLARPLLQRTPANEVSRRQHRDSPWPIDRSGCGRFRRDPVLVHTRRWHPDSFFGKRQPDTRLRGDGAFRGIRPRAIFLVGLLVLADVGHATSPFDTEYLHRRVTSDR